MARLLLRPFEAQELIWTPRQQEAAAAPESAPSPAPARAQAEDPSPPSLLVCGDAFWPRSSSPPGSEAQRAQLLSWRNHMLELMRREIAGEIEPPEAPDLLRGLTGGPRPGSPARS